MKAPELLKRLHERGITVSVRGETIRVEAPEGALTSRLKTEISASKGELLRFLHKVEGTSRSAAAGSGHMVTLQPEGTRAPLFLVHPIGGDLFCYAALVRHLGAERPLHGFRASSSSDELLAPDIQSMARSYVVELLRESGPGSGILLAGWSMGGLVAFEMARQLRAAGRQVAAVGLLDSYPPQRTSRTLGDVLRLFSRHLGESFDAAKLGLDDLIERPAQDAMDRFLREIQVSGVLDRDEGRSEWLRQRFEIFWSNLQAFDGHRVEPCDLPLILLRATGRRSRKDVAARWRMVSRRLVIEDVPGGHFSMLQEPHVAQLAETLRDALSRMNDG